MGSERTPDSVISRKSFIAGLLAIPIIGVAGCTREEPGEEPAPAERPDGSDAGTKSEITNIDDEGYVQAKTFAFDTLVSLSAYGDQAVLDHAVKECARYDDLFSRTVEGSDVWRINEAKGAPVEVSPETADLITKALEYCEFSGGLFDITIGAVTSLWDFELGRKPDGATLAEAVTHVDYHGVHVNGTTVTLDDPEAMIDLGGIAKGWIADALADLYRENGIVSGIINLGGNVMAVGEKPSGNPWRIGVQDPNSEHGGYIATVDVKNRSVVTSGLYERHFVLDGVDYHHILHPETGLPVETDLLSDTIISERSIDGDGFSTTLFIEGAEAGMKAIESVEGIEALFVNSEAEIIKSSGFDTYPNEIISGGATRG